VVAVGALAAAKAGGHGGDVVELIELLEDGEGEEERVIGRDKGADERGGEIWVGRREISGSERKRWRCIARDMALASSKERILMGLWLEVVRLKF